MTALPLIVTSESISRRILLLRGHKVMLDADLADMYGVPTKALNQAVRRNLERFPGDFMFQLTKDENLKLAVAETYQAAEEGTA